MENNNSGNKFFNGFLLGVVVGALAFFLLGTQRGKRILKSISQDKFDDLSKLFQEKEKENNVSEFMDDEDVDDELPAVYKKPKVVRFFRGISRTKH